MSKGGGGGNTTTVQKSDPWAPQQPYLRAGLGAAGDLFFGAPNQGTTAPAPAAATPPSSSDSGGGASGWQFGQDTSAPASGGQAAPAVTSQDGTQPAFGAFGQGSYHPAYFDPVAAGVPSSFNASGTVAGFTPLQYSGMQNMVDTGAFNQGALKPTIGNNTNMGSFGFLNGFNPGNSIYGAVPGFAMNNPGNPSLHNIENGNIGTGLTTRIAMDGAQGNSTLGQYAAGQMLGSSNPAWQQLSQSVAASTIPALEGQFTQGGAMNNPNAQYSISNGLASALAPYAEQNYNTQTQNQLNASNALAANALGASGALASNELGAAGQMSNNFNAGIQNILGAANGLSGNYNTGNQQTIQSQIALPGLVNANAEQATTPFQVGSAQQSQNQSEITDMVNRWNYNQNLPLNMLNAYNAAISGNYGGTQSLTQPYFQNQMANAMGTGMGALGLYNMGNQAGLWGSMGGLFGGGGAAAGGAAEGAGLSDLIGSMAMMA